MYEDFFALRLSKLRQNKGISARDMSLSIGQNANYINQIENRKMFPSMQTFFYICEYLGVSPQEFFDAENIQPRELNDLMSNLKKIDPEILPCIDKIVKTIVSKNFEKH